MATFTDKTVENFMTRCAAELEQAKAPAVPHVGTNNAKTGAANEGTLPGVTCSEKARETCLHHCYACRMCWRLNAYRRHMLENTLLRAADPEKYYRGVYDQALYAGRSTVRLNESGDFENREQLQAALQAALNMPGVNTSTFTRRAMPPECYETASKMKRADGNANAYRFALRYSLFMDLTPAQIVEHSKMKLAFPWCAVVNSKHDAQQIVRESKARAVWCPQQAAKEAGKNWTCAMCAARGLGCFSRAARGVIFVEH